jgi:hypothetical protein
MGVLMNPGQMALTLTLNLASSFAVVRVNPITPALDAE